MLPHTSTPVGVTRAVQFCGSSVAWASIWQRYSALTAPGARAAETLPAAFTRKPGRSRAASSVAKIAAVCSVAAAPLSHEIVSASAAVRAVQ